jgi:hypothetical protein
MLKLGEMQFSRRKEIPLTPSTVHLTGSFLIQQQITEPNEKIASSLLQADQ